MTHGDGGIGSRRLGDLLDEDRPGGGGIGGGSCAVGDTFDLYLGIFFQRSGQFAVDVREAAVVQE